MRTSLALFLSVVIGSTEVAGNLKEVSPHSYPWVGYITDTGDNFLCGATILSRQQTGEPDDIAITAASCILGRPLSTLILVFGDHNRTFIDGNEQTLTAKSSSILRGFSSTTFANDFILYRLNEAIIGNDFVKPIIYPARQDPQRDRILSKRCRVLGWGTEGQSSEVLNEIVVNIDNSCSPPAGNLCISNHRRSGDTRVACAERGNGVFCKRKREWYLVGIVSGWNAGGECDSRPRRMYNMFNFQLDIP